MSGSALASMWEAARLRFKPTGLVAIALVVLILGAWISYIFPAWIQDPDLSHGLFTPVLFWLLIRESLNRGPQRFLPDRPRLVSTVFLFVLVGSMLLFFLGSLYAVATEWQHPVVKFLMGSSVAGLLVSAWIYCASSTVRVIPFSWIVAVAISLWFFSLPLPPGTSHQLTLGLQFRVTDNVLRALHLFGIPAVQNGNIINLAHASVGVEEACSGVRSLLSCIYAGFFFSAAFVRSIASRITLILFAPVLALIMNFIRSLSLTLLANAGVDIEGAWHDVTGYAILVVTALLLAALAIVLERFESTTSQPKIAAPQSRPQTDSNTPFHLALMLSSGCAVALVWIVSLVAITRPAPRADVVPPEIASWLPAQIEGWTTSSPQDLYRFSNILETEDLAQRSYSKTTIDGPPLHVTIYLAYWRPGQTSVSNVASHTPDACWPGAGWVAVPQSTDAIELPLLSRRTTPAEYRVFTYNESPRHVWYWHTYDRDVLRDLDPRRPIEMISSVLRYGARSGGEQLFVRLSANRPWAEIDDDPLFTNLFEHLQPFGI